MNHFLNKLRVLNKGELLGRFIFYIERKTNKYKRIVKKSRKQDCKIKNLVDLFQNENQLLFSNDPFSLEYCGEKLDIRSISFCEDNKIWFKLKESSFAGDIRSYWESGRLQNLSLLVSNYLLSKDQLIIKSINDYLDYWFEKNPIDYGWHHISNLEIAIRFLTLYRIYYYVGDKLDIDLEKILYSYGVHLFYDIHRTNRLIPNNHSLGEAVSLLLASKLFDNKKWEKYAKKTIRKRANLITESGEFIEESSGYHLFVLQMFLILISICDDFDDLLLNRINLSIKKLSSLCDNDKNIAKYGDCDDGLFFVIDSIERNNLNALKLNYLRAGQKLDIADNKAKNMFEPQKYLSFAENSDFKVALIGGFDLKHAHVQSLSFLLWHKGEQVVSSSGSYFYNGPNEKTRIALASQKFSNAPSIENVQRDNLITKFRHKKIIKSVSLQSGDNFVSGTIKIGKTSITRKITIKDDGIEILDSSNKFLTGFRICSGDSKQPLAIICLNEKIEAEKDSFSPAYGKITKANYYPSSFSTHLSIVNIKI